MARFFRRPRNMERKNIGTLTGNDALPCVSARRITLPFPFTVIFTTRRVTLCMIVERSRRGSIILFQPTLYIPLFLPIIYNISRAPPFFREPCGFFRTGFEQPPRNLASNSPRRGNEPLFPSSRSLSLYLRIQLFLILFFTYLTFSEGKKLSIESYLHWVDSKDPRRENDARESSSRFIACRSESHGSRERVTKRRDATPGNHSNPEIFHRNERSLFSVNSL